MVEHHWAGGVRGWERQRFRHFCRAHPISECCSPARRLPSSGTARAPWALGAGFGGFGGLPTSTPSAQPHQRLQLSPASVRATSAAPKRSRDRDLTGLAPSDPSNQRTACGFEGHCSIPLTGPDSEVCRSIAPARSRGGAAGNSEAPPRQLLSGYPRAEVNQHVSARDRRRWG